jgi:hypothetical protein
MLLLLLMTGSWLEQMSSRRLDRAPRFDRVESSVRYQSIWRVVVECRVIATSTRLLSHYCFINASRTTLFGDPYVLTFLHSYIHTSQLRITISLQNHNATSQLRLLPLPTTRSSFPQPLLHNPSPNPSRNSHDRNHRINPRGGRENTPIRNPQPLTTPNSPRLIDSTITLARPHPARAHLVRGCEPPRAAGGFQLGQPGLEGRVV